MSEHATVSEDEPATEPSEPPVEAPEETPPPPARSSRRDGTFFFIAAAVIALDQLTKHLVRALLDRGDSWPDAGWVLHIVNVRNSGAAFGMLQGQTPFLIVTSLVGVAAIVLYYYFPPLDHGMLRIALGLQLGGAAGNLIDRIRFGWVTDFVNFDYFPAFNVADSSITIGVLTILWFFLVVEGEQARRKPSAGE